MQLEARAEEYLTELVAEVGEPSAADIARAEELLSRTQGLPSVAKAG